MAIKQINLVVTENFISSGIPSVITAKKGVNCISIQGNEFILYEQQRFPTGNMWVALEQVVLPTSDYFREGDSDFNPALMLGGM